jgi:hypothetical protein
MVFGVQPSLRAHRIGSNRLQLVLEASCSGIKGLLVGRANVDWNVRYANLAGSLNAVPPSCYH